MILYFIAIRNAALVFITLKIPIKERSNEKGRVGPNKLFRPSDFSFTCPIILNYTLFSMIEWKGKVGKINYIQRWWCNFCFLRSFSLVPDSNSQHCYFTFISYQIVNIVKLVKGNCLSDNPRILDAGFNYYNIIFINIYNIIP